MKKQMTEKLKTNKGITLIALVITIIVMLILVAVTISMAVNGGLFGQAGRAAKETNNAIREEQQLASGKVTIDNKVYNSIDEYLETTEGNNLGEDIQGIDGEVFTAIYAETKSYTDKNGKTAVIPKGFSVGKSEGINTIDEGLVIQDAKGNQFVWIPVEYTATGTLDENELDSGFLEVFKRSNADDDYYSEPYEYGYEGEETEYYEMMLSVQENKGFYIGRFEAGTEEPRYSGVANGTDTLVIKRDVYPYNFVAWGASIDDYVYDCIEKKYEYEYDEETGEFTEIWVGDYNQGKGAVYLSKHLLDGQTTGTVSTLCYGVQWDAMLKFMGKDEETDSTGWGNYLNNEYTIKRTTAKYSEDRGTTWRPVTSEKSNLGNCMLLTTGASDEFKLKNIYDVAGNASEWTMELSFNCGGTRVYRGGEYVGVGDQSPAAYRSDNGTTFIYDTVSFRPTLYITNE